MRLSPLLIALGFPLTLASCTPSANINVRAGSYAQDRNLATAAVERFHAQYNADQFTSIYNEAGAGFKNSAPQNVIVASMKQTKQRYGNVVTDLCVGENTFPGGQVRLAYNTKFQKGNETEMFIWQSDGQKATLQMVKISPEATRPGP